jgi:hypothetical protein
MVACAFVAPGPHIGIHRGRIELREAEVLAEQAQQHASLPRVETAKVQAVRRARVTAAGRAGLAPFNR